MKYELTTHSLSESLQFGEQFGRILRGGETIELASDLGGGKTVLVKGIARGLGFKGEVTSPTFTISRIYKLRDGLELHHFDFYRLDSSDIVAVELAEVVGDPTIIVAVEWAGHAGKSMPAKRIRIEITATSDNTREISVESLDTRFDYVIQGLQHAKH
ncbi:MAG: tRNA (adenosine(37)-N6)-threonylcarbamoyltransferase complex ATPase subunit type 1 TsaE [Candidatus Saccharimonadia bacterium]